ncbi:MAG: DUF2382 domain-containing protein [Gemmatimonas sp.]|nr:DUF2382 domain-containing protein [Gemmatimonas sp.]
MKRKDEREQRSATGREENRDARLTRSEEELIIGKESVEAGEVDIGKRVETEHVKRPVKRMHEEVEVERHPVTGVQGSDARIGEEEISIPLKEEKLVVEKRPRVKEEIVARKRLVEEQEEVEADIRKERFYVEERGRDKRDSDKKRGLGL